MTDKGYDVIIIGAGVIGSNIAFELSKAGCRTLNVDKLPASGYGSTAASCAIVRVHYSTWAGVAMAYEGFHYWKRWPEYLEGDDEQGLAEFIQTGGVYVGNECRYRDKVLPLFDELGIPYEVWDVDQLQSELPNIDAGRYAPPKRHDDETFWDEADQQITSAVYTPLTGYVSDPQLAAHNLQRAAEAKGGEFLFNAEVSDVCTKSGRVLGVSLADGTEIKAPIAINVAGPHSFVINRMAGVADSMTITTKALRHEVHHVSVPEGFTYDRDGFIVGDDDMGTYMRPAAGNNILLGSQDPECDPQVWIPNPDQFDHSITDDQWRTQVLRLAKRFPNLGVPHERKGIVDLYDVSDDWIPIYDKTDLDGFYVAIGTSGNQFKNASVAAHCMTYLIDRVEAGHDHDSDPVKVPLIHTGLELDMSAFSRNREINQDSSFSVLG
ncbi:MAG TPA: FAD-dependent oxidoreductase [Acidimicrobiia bacterium]|jgi:sarcosine oxidase subunit beta|nr:FAD-dependent oxidoreductase [Acidimicrobiia bacterium]